MLDQSGSVTKCLLVNNHCISDATASVTQSLRTIIEWLADAGHACHVPTTARFESRVPFTVEEHLRQQGVDASHRSARVVRYRVKKVPVTMLRTRHNDELRPNRTETARYLSLFDEFVAEFAPTHLIACNGHAMILEAMARGIVTAFAVRGFGYYDERYFANVDHTFKCSQFLTDVYRERVGLVSTPLELPLE
jgi:hypothetical protein